MAKITTAGGPSGATSQPVGASQSLMTEDGVWRDASSLIPGGGVASVFGRTGAVAAQSGDYTPAQVGALPVLTEVSVTGSGALAVNTITTVTASALATMTLPASVAGSLIVVERESTSTANVAVTGSIRGVGGSTLTLQLSSESEMLYGDGTTWWVAAGHKTLSSLQALFVTGTTPAASVNLKPASPAGTESTTLVMMGLGAAASQPLLYTPAGTGKVRIDLRGEFFLTNGVTNAVIGPRYGTGTAPANTAAVTGTRWGTPADSTLRGGATSGTANASAVFFTDIITVTPGTQIWIDLAVASGASADEVTLQNISCTIQELAS